MNILLKMSSGKWWPLCFGLKNLIKKNNIVFLFLNATKWTKLNTASNWHISLTCIILPPNICVTVRLESVYESIYFRSMASAKAQVALYMKSRHQWDMSIIYQITVGLCLLRKEADPLSFPKRVWCPINAMDMVEPTPFEDDGISFMRFTK